MSKEDFRQFGGSTPELSINGLNSYGRLIDIYDGDTIKVILPTFGSYYKFTIRLNDIDTCEIRSKDKILQDNAIKARDRLFELATTSKVNTKNDIKKILEADVYLVWVECCNKDKYGRVLANIYKDKGSIKSFSEILLEEKLAYKYEGKTKLSDDDLKNELNIAS
jgi:endonuclease YncB( thermonuclease family)